MRALIAAFFIVSFFNIVVAQVPPPRNVAIADAVEDELARDPYIDLNAIDVFVQDGIVTLQGQVPMLVAKEHAEKIAGAIAGVSGVVNNLQVRTITRPDTEILVEVRNDLANDPVISKYQIATTVNNGRVTLTGVVNSREERDIVENIVSRVGGVAAVNDMIAFNYPTKRPDAAVADDIRRVLRSDPYIQEKNIQVVVDNGVVRLMGTAWNVPEKERVTADAWVPGVKAVDNSELLIAGWARKPEVYPVPYYLTDYDLARVVQEAIQSDPRIVSINIQADVYGGIVTLRGVVNNLRGWQVAEQRAWSVPGVLAVNNRLKIRTGVHVPDGMISAAISDAFVQNPMLNLFNINLQVKLGVVYMDGYVSSEEARNQATDIAAAADGVRSVINNLRVREVVAANPPAMTPPPAPAPRAMPLKNDSAIENDIRRIMFHNPALDASRIQIKVAMGTAVLSGEVSTEAERRAAEKLAFDAGASRVNNLIQVRAFGYYESPPPPPIAQNVPPSEVQVVPPEPPSQPMMPSTPPPVSQPAPAPQPSPPL